MGVTYSLHCIAHIWKQMGKTRNKEILCHCIALIRMKMIVSTLFSLPLIHIMLNIIQPQSDLYWISFTTPMENILHFSAAIWFLSI